jgi:hypothetical protein
MAALGDQPICYWPYVYIMFLEKSQYLEWSGDVGAPYRYISYSVTTATDLYENMSHVANDSA